MSPLGRGAPALFSSPALMSALLAFRCAPRRSAPRARTSSRPRSRDRTRSHADRADPPPSPLSLLLPPPFLALTSVAQSAKVFTHWYTTGKLDWGRIVGSGGMPSSHTALVVGLTTAVGLKDSLESSVFALCLVFSLVVMYDATGVRLQAGRHAEVLNQMILELPTQHPVSDTRPLRDSLGHTPVEVGAGALVGLFVGWLHYSAWVTQWGP